MVSAAAWMDELKSGQGLTRLLSQRGAQVLAIVLLLLLGLDSAVILTRAFGHASALPSAGAPGPAAARPALNPALQLAVILNAHLFGSAAVTANGEAPTTTMPLILAGVIADKDPAKGQAILGESATSAKLYAVGGAIPGGAHLHAVYSDRVLLERNGVIEALMLPRTSKGGGFVAAPAGAPQPRVTQASAAANPTLLAGLVRVQPVFAQGKLQGYRIFPGGARGTSAFNQLGLRSGDMIQAINGSALDDAGRAMDMLQTLSSAATATITVSRNGQPQEVNLNLSTLSIDPADGTDGAAAPASESAPPGPGSPGPSTNGPARLRAAPSGGANLGAAPGSGPTPGGNINPPSNGADPPNAGERER